MAFNFAAKQEKCLQCGTDLQIAGAVKKAESYQNKGKKICINSMVSNKKNKRCYNSNIVVRNVVDTDWVY